MTKRDKVIVVCACLTLSVVVGLAMPWMVETLECLWDNLLQALRWWLFAM